VAEKKARDKGTKGIKERRKEMTFPNISDRSCVHDHIVLMVVR
jgi:hypothetical protein